MPTGLWNDPTIPWTEHVEALGPLEIDYTADEVVVRRTIDLLPVLADPTKLIGPYGNAPWDAAAQALLGYSQVKTSPSKNRYISRAPPDGFAGIPVAAGGIDPLTGSVIPYVYCTSVRVRGLKPTGKVTQLRGNLGALYDSQSFAKYQQARLSVEYRPLEYDIRTDADMISRGFTLNIPGRAFNNNPQDPAGVAVYFPGLQDAACPDESTLTRYVVRRAVPAGQYLGVRGNTYKYVGGANAGLPVAEQVGRMLCNINYTLTWKNVPIDGIPCSLINPGVPPGTGAIENCLGRVNRPGFANFYPGTLLYMSCEFRALRNRFGIRSYDVMHGFKWFSPGLDTSTYQGFAGGNNNAPPAYARDWLSGVGAALQTAGATIMQGAGVSTAPPAVPNSFPAGHNHLFNPNTGRWTQATITGLDNFAVLADYVSVYDWRDFNNLFRPPPVQPTGGY